MNIFKAMSRITFLFLLTPIIFSHCSSSRKVTLSSTEIKNIIDSTQFIFVAERVNPLRGSSRNLTSYYDVMVKPDTIKCFLPYFGRSYQAPIDPSKGGLDFTSTNFSLDKISKKRNESQILIDPHDISDVQQLTFNIFENGTATLNIVNTHKDPISFYGHIEKIKE